MEARLWPDTMVLLACICAACSAQLEVLTLSLPVLQPGCCKEPPGETRSSRGLLS